MLAPAAQARLRGQTIVWFVRPSRSDGTLARRHGRSARANHSVVCMAAAGRQRRHGRPRGQTIVWFVRPPRGGGTLGRTTAGVRARGHTGHACARLRRAVASPARKPKHGLFASKVAPRPLRGRGLSPHPHRPKRAMAIAWSARGRATKTRRGALVHSCSLIRGGSLCAAASSPLAS